MTHAAPPDPASVQHPEHVVASGNEALRRLRDITSTINSGGDLQTVLERVLLAVCDGKPWTRGGIMAVNRASGFSELVAAFAPGERPGERHVTRWALATSPVLRVAEQRRPLVIPDAQLAAGFGGYQADAVARNYRTVVLLPLGCTTAEEHEMVLSIHTEDRVEVPGEELEVLTTVAHLVAIAVDKVKHLRAEQRQTERLRRVLETGSHLMETVLDGVSPAVTAGLIGAILPDPFVILDFVADTVTVRRSPEPETLDEREWRALAEGRAAPLLAALVERVGAGGAATEDRLDFAGVGVPLAVPVLTEPLRVAGETVGGLLVFPRSRPLDSLDRVVTQEVRFALAAQIMRQHAEAKRESQDMSRFFERLCRTGGANPEQALAQGRRLGLDLGCPARLIAVAPPPVRGEPPLAALRRLLMAEMGRAVGGATLIEHEGAVIVCWPVSASADQPSQTTLAQHVLRPLRARWGGQPIVAFGPICRKPGDYGAAAAECAQVLHLARAFGRAGVLRRSDFGSFGLLLSALDASAMRDFVDAILGPLRRHDADHGGGMVETASTFVEEACRYQATAERLGIHVTTLRHRLRRLQELFGLDLEDAEARFRVSFATRLSSMVDAAEGARTADS